MNDIETKSGLAQTPGYRYAKVTGNQLHVAGQVPQDSSGNIVGINDPYTQAVQCLENLKILMSCYDFFKKDIQLLTIYVVGSRDNLTTAWKAILEEFSNNVPPATIIGVSVLGYEEQLVEIDATIVKSADNKSNQKDNSMKSKCPPDLSSRPLKMTWEGFLNASPEKVYEAWTSKFDLWFAQPGVVFMTPEVDKPYFFYNKNEWGRHPHYGRFLELKENEVVEMTWVTGNGSDVGTEGAETVIRLELALKDNGTMVHFTHSGFVNERSRDSHKENWPLAFEGLEKVIQN